MYKPGDKVKIVELPKKWMMQPAVKIWQDRVVTIIGMSDITNHYHVEENSYLWDTHYLTNIDGNQRFRSLDAEWPELLDD